ncbi:MAG: hypothetical protein IKO78_04870 [Bacilli bacterium]|nr:hypothetical protein [Bacilli bacterium]
MNNNHLIDVLKLINRLQKEATIPTNASCTKPLLGDVNSFNTRPVTFYSCNNSLLTVNYYTDNTLNTSSVFRVEDINNSCVTVRLLAQEEGAYVATEEFATININCICAIRCLNDINLTI